MPAEPSWSALLPATVLTPLGFAVVIAALGGSADRAARVVGAIGATVTAALALAVTYGVREAGTVVTHELAGWPAPLGITVRADGLAAVLLGLSAIVGLVTSYYAAAGTRATETPRHFWALWFLAWSGLHTVVIAGDLFNTYVGLEVLGLAAVGMVALGGPTSWSAALRYVFVAVAGSLCFLLAVAIVYARTDTLDIVLAGQRIHDSAVASGGPAAAGPELVALALATVGMALKTALFPVHGWLPPAHADAPAAVSPLLSALVVKASFVVLVRMWFQVIGGHRGLAVLLAVLACAAIGWGGLMALRESRLKRLVAYSTVAQIGYLFLLFPLTTFAPTEPARALAWMGVLAMVVAHAVAKAALFLAAGSVKLGLGDDDLAGLEGAARQFPMVAMTVGVSAVSLAGLPITLGFAAKWQLAASAIGSGQWWVVAVLVLGGLLAAGYLLRPIAAMLRGSDAHEQELPPTPADVPRAQQVLPLLLAVGVVVLGLQAGAVMDLAMIGAPMGAR